MTKKRVAFTERSPSPYTRASHARSTPSESVIGAELAIEGSITGSGSVRLAGRFTGDVTVVVIRDMHGADVSQKLVEVVAIDPHLNATKRANLLDSN